MKSRLSWSCCCRRPNEFEFGNRTKTKRRPEAAGAIYRQGCSRRSPDALNEVASLLVAMADQGSGLPGSSTRAYGIGQRKIEVWRRAWWLSLATMSTGVQRLSRVRVSIWLLHVQIDRAKRARWSRIVRRLYSEPLCPLADSRRER